MNIEQLYEFRIIVEKKTFSEAALFLHVSQSSLSKQIMKLEAELDVQLFDRSKRQITLTYYGEIVYEHAKKLLQIQEQMIKKLQEQKQGVDAELKIAMLPIFSQYDLSNRIEEFQKEHKNLNLQVIEMEERDLEYMLEQDVNDIYILRGDIKELQKFKKFPISEDRLVAVLPSTHPLCKKEIISLSDLQQEPLLLYPRYTMIRKLTEQVCQEAGFQPIIKRYGRMHTLLAAARKKEGIVLAMEQSLQMYQLEGLKVLSIQGPILSHIYLYVKPSALHKSSVRNFVDKLRI